ncbi:hypothetical protein BDV37DRAFT_282925 [Aspergillus pseudonomiae]|uniref:Uncharacterized protein n=1 Tax=Aspergillus pseudonomiae TaxID=1506151 RepID=A0A5N7DD30_9EURO|nr:uncharacterized protein BDV37DRAFT_282925 [Aspergillus pseudonomiae]KAE8404376.1 hypothetical protein BDV37DRAFT_282925 [Aspergillus pseudonomiae]
MVATQAFDFLPLQNKFEAPDLVRPWMSYWPPQPGSAVYEWFRAEFPEALEWSFNPDKPFDRPMKGWKQKARTLGKDCAVDLLPPTEIPTASMIAPDLKRTPVNDQEEELEQRTRCNEIDQKLRVLGLPSCEVTGFNYLDWSPKYQIEKPFHSRLPVLDCLSRSNVATKAYTVPVYNIAGFEGYFSLAISGFQFIVCPSGMVEWSDAEVQRLYLPRMRLWLQEHFKASFVYIYSYNLRCEDPKRSPSVDWTAPVPFAHCGNENFQHPAIPGDHTAHNWACADVTPEAIYTHLKLYLPGKADEIRTKRHRFVNIWRPLTGPHQDMPLAVCDYRSLKHSDLVASDAVLTHYCGEGYDVRYSPYHRWFYKRGMHSDEAIMFKLYDSNDSEALLCPHAAFKDPSAPVGTPKRASIELRAIIVD